MTTTTIHDTGESYSSPAWPIRVGARYRALKGPLHSPEPLAITFHVITIDGDSIHYTLTHDGQTEPYTVKESPAVLFRRLCLPEDASPCTRLFELLREMAPLVHAAQAWHNFHHGSQMVQCDAICAALPAAMAALVEAEHMKESGTHEHHG